MAVGGCTGTSPYDAVRPSPACAGVVTRAAESDECCPHGIRSRPGDGDRQRREPSHPNGAQRGRHDHVRVRRRRQPHQQDVGGASDCGVHGDRIGAPGAMPSSRPTRAVQAWSGKCGPARPHSWTSRGTRQTPCERAWIWQRGADASTCRPIQASFAHGQGYCAAGGHQFLVAKSATT